MKILIAGDSWGCGEWGTLPPDKAWILYYDKSDDITVSTADNSLPESLLLNLKTHGFNIKPFRQPAGHYTVLHNGLQKYLEDAGHTVKNVSSGGASNIDSVDRLKQHISDEYDHVIWFQTDPIRNLRPYTDFTSRFTTVDSLLSYQLETLQQSYAELNSLGKKINCLGGCSKLDSELMSKFNNLYPIIDSIPEFLFPNFVHPTIWLSDWYSLVGKQFDMDSLDKLLYNKKLQDSLVHERELFWPDGRHPNRHAHKIIFNYLVDHLI